ncbi:hypothetical protein KJ966_29225 [bacterium]|nr:hypothetical protein [bacterium]
MTIRKKVLMILVAIIALNVAITGINILQNGIGGWDGKTMDVIMKTGTNEATPMILESLSKSEIMQLFYSAPAPEFKSMKGEYKAGLLPVGIMATATGYYTHNLFGPGHWEGKAFFPFQEDRGWGYNIFSSNDGAGNTVLHRTRKMDTWVGKSEIDNKDSFHLVYKEYNGGLVHSMHDEVRKINDELYICMGYMAAGGGSINPAPFYIYQKPTPWIGPDEEQ